MIAQLNMRGWGKPFGLRAFVWLAIMISTEELIEATKLRSWVGPSLFFEGQLPPIRGYHGFIANDEDNNLYLFGGYGASGTSITRSLERNRGIALMFRMFVTCQRPCFFHY